MAARKNPGNQWSQKDWRDAIRQAVNEKTGGEKRLRVLARVLVNAGLEGDIEAIKEIGNRLDGRPAQALEHSGPQGGPLVVTWLPPQ